MSIHERPVHTHQTTLSANEHKAIYLANRITNIGSGNIMKWHLESWIR